ncbi:hypothetical protein [Flavobacterium defluvii]|uniref:Outer membrane protein beta-barrel domain-containing protein n=1 Tax=Flavobacterium defluvii TaxID=370979 RepID=A0A1M5EBV8_9FLAO|nr:hypothetical protein [Flavobacterium defluvii]SHF76666.1 hypothetical protein SAMN05443663_10188 [Flavobacterium defluvii]
MKSFRLLLVCIILSFISLKSHSQEKINFDDIKLDISKFIFYGKPDITKCDGSGTVLESDDYAATNAPLYSTFTIHKKQGDNYIISFLDWSTSKSMFKSEDTYNKNLVKALTYNYLAPKGTFEAFNSKTKSNDKNITVTTLRKEAFYLISKNDLKEYAYKYDPKPSYEFNYGTISYLARMRPKVGNIPGKWSTDLNLGLTAGVRKNIGKNFGLSLLAGIGITKISLDSISTKGVVKTTSEKPALTPSLNLLFSYQNFSIGFGAGMDWINEDSKESSAWIYNNKIFYGIGFGINIFQSSSNQNKTELQIQ